MGGADGGHAGERRRARPGQAGDLAGVVQTELADDDLGVLRGGEQRERHADEIVEVAGGGVGAAHGAEAGAQHVLRGGLAHGARDAHDEPLGVAAALLGGERQQERLAVVVLGAQDGGAGGGAGRKRVGGHLGRGHHGGGAGLRGGGKVGVAVDLLAGEGDEDRPLRGLARVDHGVAGNVPGALVDELGPGGLGDFCGLDANHSPS